jgi:NhaP-type Na+/H+ and K+/H+ antiporter
MPSIEQLLLVTSILLILGILASKTSGALGVPALLGCLVPELTNGEIPSDRIEFLARVALAVPRGPCRIAERVG